MVQPGWSLVLDYISLLRMISLTAYSFEKEFKNMVPQSNKSPGNILVDTWFKIINKKN